MTGRSTPTSRNTLANANQARDWKIHADFAQHLIHVARNAHVDDTLPGLAARDTVYALDSSTIDLCLSLFPWARFRRTKGAVKLHTLLDLRGNIPAFIHVSDGKLHDVNVLDMLLPEAGSFYVMDRAYLDFERLHHLHLCGAFFVLRAKSNTRLRRLSSRPVDRTTGLICDQVVRPSGVHSATDYPDPLRRIRYRDAERDKTLVFLTNNFVLPALTITELYRARWQVELFLISSSKYSLQTRGWPGWPNASYTVGIAWFSGMLCDSLRSAAAALPCARAGFPGSGRWFPFQHCRCSGRISGPIRGFAHGHRVLVA